MSNSSGRSKKKLTFSQATRSRCIYNFFIRARSRSTLPLKTRRKMNPGRGASCHILSRYLLGANLFFKLPFR